MRTSAKQFEKWNRRRRLALRNADIEPEGTDEEHEAAIAQVRRRLTAHFAALSEKQRVAVVLHYLYGYELTEIADLLDAKVNAVRSRLRQGLAQLRPHILADPGLREWVREGRQ